MDERLDSVTMKILWDRLVSIVDQASVAHVRTAFSTIVREANDLAASLLTTDGYTLASSQHGLPSFVATQAFTLQHLLSIYTLEDLSDGDILISNDPYVGTGQVMDITLMKPIFRKGRVVAFGGSVAHSPDLGGAQRWNRATDVFDEGLQIPALKLYNEGQADETLMKLIKANSRLPDLTMGDLEAQLSSIHVIESRLLEVMDEYELSDLDEIKDEIFSRSEDAMRAAISEIPDGVYTAESYADAYDPAEEAIRIRVEVAVNESSMSVDYTGSSAKTSGPFNSTWTFTSAYALYVLRTLLVPMLPNNGGFYKPIQVICPENSVVAAGYPSPTLCRHMVGHQVVDSIMLALAPIMPAKAIAPSGSAPTWNLLLMGRDSQSRPYHRLVNFNGGAGASAESDGLPVSFPANIGNTPVEILESLMPIVCEVKEGIQDSDGAGRRRGSGGQRIVFRALEEFTYSIIGGRTEFPAVGLNGGEAGACGRILVDGRLIRSGSDGRVGAGGKLTIETPGGGGFGPPLDREPDRVLKDVIEEWVSRERAQEIWGVVIDQDTLTVDQSKTRSLRSNGIEEHGTIR